MWQCKMTIEADTNTSQGRFWIVFPHLGFDSLIKAFQNMVQLIRRKQFKSTVAIHLYFVSNIQSEFHYLGEIIENTPIFLNHSYYVFLLICFSKTECKSYHDIICFNPGSLDIKQGFHLTRKFCFSKQGIFQPKIGLLN